MADMDVAVIDAAGLQQLVSVLQDLGYRVVGPTVSGDAIVLDQLEQARALGEGRASEAGFRPVVQMGLTYRF